jgi:hypothetical protein
MYSLKEEKNQVFSPSRALVSLRGFFFSALLTIKTFDNQAAGGS